MRKKILENGILVCGLALLFLIGVYVGNSVSFSGDLEGDLYATGSNATSSDATSSNATSTDATSSNATSGDATSSNVHLNDNIMVLDSFSLGSASAKASDKVNVNFTTTGACVNGATLQLVRNDGKYTISMIVKDIGKNSYVELPDFINTGDYVVKSLLIVGSNSDGTTFSRNFASNPSLAGDTKYNFNSKIHLDARINNVDVDLIESINLNKTSFTKGTKLFIDVSAHKDVRAIRLNFVKISDSRYTFYSYINSIRNKPYLLIPSSAATGDYVLDNIYVETYNYGSVVYTNKHNNESKYVDYKEKYVLLDQNASDQEVMYYNNEDIDSEVIDSLKGSTTINEIHVMAEDDSVISEELLRSVGSRKFYVHYKDVLFTFANISSNKMFDASVEYKVIDKNDDISKIVPDGIMMTFASNGTLPGNAKITLNNKDMIKKAFKDNKVNIYYYHDDINKFEVIEEDVSLNNDILEYNITHTSSYIITNSKVSSTYVYSASDRARDNEVDFKKSDKVNKLLIAIGAIVIIIAVLVVLLLKGNKSSNSDNDKEEIKKEEKEEKEEDSSEETNEEDLDEEQIIENISKANEESFDDEEE